MVVDLSLKNKNGFFLVEALLSVLIVSVLAWMVSSCIKQRVQVSESLKKKRLEMNAVAEEKMKEMVICPNYVEDMDIS